MRLDVNAPRGARPAAARGGRSTASGTTPPTLDVLGEGGHGVALWVAERRRRSWVGDARRRSTARRAARCAGCLAARRLVVVPAGAPRRAGRGVPPPAAAARPGGLLRRLGRGARAGRAAAGARRHLGARPTRCELAWTLALPRRRRRPGLRAVRDPRAARRAPSGAGAGAARRRCELDDEQAYHLCRGHRRDLGLEDEPDVPRRPRDPVRRGAAARACAEQVEVEEIGGQPDYREPSTGVAGHPLRHPRGHRRRRRPRTDWLDLEVEISVDGQSPRAGARAGGAHQGHGPGDPAATARTSHRPPGVRPARGAGRGRRRAARAARRRRSGSATTTSTCGTSSPRSASSTSRRPSGCGPRRRCASLETLPEVEPVGLKAELRPYQLDGLPVAGVPLAEPGSAASSPTTWGSARRCRRSRWSRTPATRGAAPFLVVAPTSVVVDLGARGRARSRPGLDVRVVTESQARRGESVARPGRRGRHGRHVVHAVPARAVRATSTQSWGGLVLDEAQTVKNHHGKTYQAVRRLDVPFRLALTGTPMENRLMELWSLLSIVAPGLYPWPQRFTEMVADPGRAARRPRGARAVPPPHPAVPAAPHQGAGRRRPAAPSRSRCSRSTLTPRHRAIYDTHLQRERQTVLGLVDETSTSTASRSSAR